MNARALGVLAVVALLIQAVAPRAAGPEADARASAAVQQLLDHAPVARQYSATRRLEASGSGRHGWLDVQTDFSGTSGLSYQVTAEGGSGYIRSHVLRSLLDEEQKLIERNATASVAINSDNYELTPEGIDEDGLVVVTLRPLRKERPLIDGRMFLTADGALVRVEGRLAKNPSFWTTRVSLVRSYQQINGVTMPVSLESRAQLRFLGSSSLRMTYRYAQIDDRAVSGQQAAEPLQP
jgi:hypothetical protein